MSAFNDFGLGMLVSAPLMFTMGYLVCLIREGRR